VCVLVWVITTSAASADHHVADEETAADETQAAAADPSAVDSQAQTSDADIAESMPLSIEQAINLALENNLDVETQRFGPLFDEQKILEARGAYDPEFFGEFGYSDKESLSSFQFFPESRSETTDGVGGFRGLIPILGAEYDFQFAGKRTTTNSPAQSLSPSYEPSFSLNLTQPLLRGLIWNESWTRIKTSRLKYQESLSEFRQQVMATVKEVENAYWDLVAKGEQKAVAEKSLETAEALLSQTKTQYEVGVVSKVEVVEADAGVAEREFILIRDDNFHLSAQDKLGDLLFGSRFTADSNMRIEATDRPEDFVHYELAIEDAIQVAFRRRPELATIDDKVERQTFERKFARNQRLPSLDVKVGYGNEGLGGKCNDSLSAANLTACQNTRQEGNFGDSLDDLLTDDAADQFTARAVFSIPLTNTTARARASQADIELRRIKTEKRRIEQTIILEVRKAIRDMKSTYEGIVAARRSSAASAEQLRAEKVRLEYGESTPFDVLQREEDFVGARSREIEALRLYRNSVTGLLWAQGSILSNRNIVIDTVRTLR
jgi:outer membrane protein TolC